MFEKLLSRTVNVTITNHRTHIRAPPGKGVENRKNSFIAEFPDAHDKEILFWTRFHHGQPHERVFESNLEERVSFLRCRLSPRKIYLSRSSALPIAKQWMPHIQKGYVFSGPPFFSGWLVDGSRYRMLLCIL